MGRKRSDSTATQESTEAAGQQTPDPNGVQSAAELGADDNKPTGSAKPSLSKRDAVQQALKKGINSPTKIAEYARQEYGLEITTAHVSTIKGDLKREKAGKAKGNSASKQAQAAPVAQAEQKTKQAAPAMKAAGLTIEDLAALADLAERAGGVECLQDYLNVLKRLH